ncbi:MAG: sugar phosphate isomerase/epimerase, partial [Candidatus Omnitrophica bacterium]|nr:sugar phosphate isomerase/epimerase [Candidatus Omnitrophota bacterium]
MKKSINIGVLGNRELKEGLKIIKEAGFEAVELNYKEEMESEGYVEELRRMVSDAGLEIASLLIGWPPLTSDNPEKRKKGEELLIKSIKICQSLVTDAVLVVPGIVGTLWGGEEKVRYDIAYQRAQESIKKAIPLAEEKKVYICVENVWNKFLLSPL